MPSTTSNSKLPRVAIIGAGIGGTATAARLAHAGYQVDVYEKNDFSGGRCSLIVKNGFRFDQGPSLYLMPAIFAETFRDVGEDIDRHVKLLRCDPNYRLHFHDGDTMELNSDLAHMRNVLEKQEPGSYERWLALERESHVHYEVSVEKVLRKNFVSIWDFFTLENLKMALNLHIHQTLYGRVASFFKSDKLRKAFTFQSMYMGMSPYDAPATYSLLQYSEFAEGIWYPAGGFHTVVSKLESIAKARGAKFHYSAPVAKINIDASTERTTGITLEDGSVVNADIVVCNADLVWAYTKLLPPTPYSRRLEKKDQTSSSFSFYWGLKRKIPELGAHNVFLAEHYRESFDEIFRDHSLPTEPSFYIHVPSRLDTSAAPAGKDAITVLVPTGCIDPQKEQDFPAMLAKARNDVLRTLEARLKIKDFASLIETEIVNTPQVWTDKFNIYQGSILGLSHTVPQVCWFRPATRHADHPNLFFVGASAHPGTGVPVVLYGARLVANQIADLVQRGKLHVKGGGASAPLGLWVALFVAALSILVWALGGMDA
ncbi:phytoene dehydrogenase-like protein [Blastocladiella britannica]|nr:phytoene dehydrogenase-like protein [Blastocladiella britannica]